MKRIGTRTVITLTALIMFLMLPISGCSGPPATLTEQQRLDDFQFLYEVMRDNYPLFGVVKRSTGLDWLGKYDAYKALVIASKNDLDFAASIERMLADLRQGHTHLLTPESYEIMAQMIAEVSKLPAYEGHTTIATLSKVLFDSKVVETYDQWQNFRRTTRKQGNSASPVGHLEPLMLVADKLAYIRVSSFVDNDKDDSLILDFIQEVKDYPALVIDIRGNSGGPDLYWMNKIVSRLISKPVSYTRYHALRGGEFGLNYWGASTGLQPIAALPPAPAYPPELFSDFRYVSKSNVVIEPRDSVGFAGEIYLLVDKRVFSAAEGFALFAKQTGWATLVGQRTGGDGGGGTPIMFKLPNSGLVVRMRLELTLNPDGSVNAEARTVPDIEVAPRADALEVVLDLLGHK